MLTAWRRASGCHLLAILISLLSSGLRPVSAHKTVEGYAPRDKASRSSADAKVVLWLHDVFLVLLAAGLLPRDGLHSL